MHPEYDVIPEYLLS